MYSSTKWGKMTFPPSLNHCVRAAGTHQALRKHAQRVTIEWGRLGKDERAGPAAQPDQIPCKGESALATLRGLPWKFRAF